MAKKYRKKTASRGRRGRDSRIERLRKALAKQPKSELVRLVLELATRDTRTLNELEAWLGVEPADEDLVDSICEAIADATALDERHIGYDFDYDYRAYDKVRRGLQRLVKAGALRQAMDLCVELMRKGSYQVEMSDEGIMTYDIEGCIEVVVGALKQSDLPPEAIARWCDDMLAADRVSCICRDQLQTLRKHAAG